MALTKTEIQARWVEKHPNYFSRYMKRWKSKHPVRYMVNKARWRAKHRGVPFSIKFTDVVIPEFCPVLGIPLVWGSEKKSDNSPSLDCFVPCLGYIPSNISVISMRANRLKGDATLAEVEKIATWMRGIQC